MDTATKRPWRIGQERRPGHILIMSEGIKRGDFVIAETLLVEGKLVGNYEDNARLIVHCVNTHDELVEALKECVKVMDFTDLTDNEQIAFDKAKQVLEKAEAV